MQTVHTCDYCLEGETFEKQNWHKYAVICIRMYASSWNKGLLFFMGQGGWWNFNDSVIYDDLLLVYENFFGWFSPFKAKFFWHAPPLPVLN